MNEKIKELQVKLQEGIENLNTIIEKELAIIYMETLLNLQEVKGAEPKLQTSFDFFVPKFQERKVSEDRFYTVSIFKSNSIELFHKLGYSTPFIKTIDYSDNNLEFQIEFYKNLQGELFVKKLYFNDPVFVYGEDISHVDICKFFNEFTKAMKHNSGYIFKQGLSFSGSQDFSQNYNNVLLQIIELVALCKE